MKHLLTAATVAAVIGTILACTDTTRPVTPEITGRQSTVVGSAGVIRVSAGDMHGWAFIDDQQSTACTDVTKCQLADGPATPPIGSASAMLATTAASDGVALMLQDYAGTRLDQITELRYSTYRQSTDAGNNLAIALQFTVDFDLNDASNAWQGRLVFEPYHAAGGQVAGQVWHEWNAMDGKWWGTRASVVRNDVTVSNACVQASPCTWAQLLAAFPNLGVHRTYGSVFLKAGSGWAGFRGNVDALSIGVAGATTTFDFEVAALQGVPALPPDTLPQWVHDVHVFAAANHSLTDSVTGGAGDMSVVRRYTAGYLPLRPQWLLARAENGDSLVRGAAWTANAAQAFQLIRQPFGIE